MWFDADCAPVSATFKASGATNIGMQTGMVKATSARKSNAVFEKKNRRSAMTLTPPLSRKAGRSLRSRPKSGQRSNGNQMATERYTQDKAK
jgi:hypothetical protein